jgi:hypothetical protein
MVEVGTYQVNEVRTWLSSKLDEVARWRDAKAAEYPDDERNAHSAAALKAAAQYVRTAEPHSHGLLRITRLVETAHLSELDLLKPAFVTAPLPGLESQRVASRFGFENRPGVPDKMECEEFLDDLARAIVRDLSERLFELDPNSPLAKLLRSESAAPTDPSLAQLAAMADTLRAIQEAESSRRQHEQLRAIARLVINVRDVALAEADANGSVQGLGQKTLPQARLELRLASATYRAETGRELSAVADMATGSTMTSSMKIVGAATDSLEELLREVGTA